MAVTAPTTVSRPRVTVSYDDLGDVLHIVLGKAVPYEGDGLAEGVELDFALDDDAPCGAKVIGYRKNRWSGRLDELARIVGKHLAIEPGLLKTAIDRQTTH